MPQKTRYFVEIAANASKARICCVGWKEFVPIPGLNLSENASLSIKGKETKLGNLVRALIRYDQDWLGEWFDESGQYDTGCYLYKQLFGEEPPEKFQKENSRVDLRIVSRDENVSRLPWVLLAHDGIFLSTAGWAVSLANSNPDKDYELPPLPKMLVVAPQPTDLEKTKADEHIRDLKDMLAAPDLTLVDDDHLKTVTSWSDFLHQLKSFQPDILYYYGHGEGDEYTSKLIFEDKKLPLTDFRSELNNLSGNSPLLAYINCCKGDTGGLLGAGKQLVGIIPAVLTNRTTAYIDTARKQGMAFWEALLLRGEAPHDAVAGIRGRLNDLDQSTHDSRWMTPVLHCQYAEWKANPPLPPSRLDRDPHWQFKLDRVKQFSVVFFLTHQMLKERKPRALAYLWYGTPNQGVDIFRNRLRLELEENLHDTEVIEVNPEWPGDLQNPAQSFQDMICQAFDIKTLEHLAGRIRTQVRQQSGKRILVYVSHLPIPSEEVFHPKEIKPYLNWWDSEFVPSLPENTHAILGISCETKETANLYKFLTEKQKLKDIHLSDTVFELLDELEKVTRDDLVKFIDTHKIYVDKDIMDKVLDATLEKTEGSYIKILDEMRELENRTFQKIRKKSDDNNFNEEKLKLF